MAQFPWNVSIRPANRGIIVEVGCQTMVFVDKEIPEFLQDLNDLITNPKTHAKLRKKYYPEDEPCNGLTEMAQAQPEAARNW